MLCPVCNGGGWEYFFSGIQYGFSGDLYENIDIPADKGARKITLKYCHDCYFMVTNWHCNNWCHCCLDCCINSKDLCCFFACC